MHSIRFAAAALLVGIVAPFALAQTSPTPPATPAPSTPAKPTAPAPPASIPATPAPPEATPGPAATTTTKSTTKTTTTTSDTGVSVAAGACHTRKAVGAKCACLKDPSQIGTAEDDPDSARNWCKV